jgi:hypothetical protein
LVLIVSFSGAKLVKSFDMTKKKAKKRI